MIDVINDLDFPEANQLLRYARPMARKLLRLKERAKKAGVPVIYVNDNFGRWQSDFRRQVQHCLREDSRGHEIVSSTGGGRLFCPQAEALRLLFDHARNSPALPRFATADHHRHRRQLLRPVHGERRLHARLRPDHSFRLHGFEHSGGEPRSAGVDAEIPESGYSALHEISVCRGRERNAGVRTARRQALRGKLSRGIRASLACAPRGRCSYSRNHGHAFFYRSRARARSFLGPSQKRSDGSPGGGAVSRPRVSAGISFIPSGARTRRQPSWRARRRRPNSRRSSRTIRARPPVVRLICCWRMRRKTRRSSTRPTPRSRLFSTNIRSTKWPGRRGWRWPRIWRRSGKKTKH